MTSDIDPNNVSLDGQYCDYQVGGKRRIFNFLESAPIKAFASL